jgi:hypothetical protein
MNEHRSRHRTHTVKPANGVIGPLGKVVKAVPAAALVSTPVLEPATPATVPAVVETV